MAVVRGFKVSLEFRNFNVFTQMKGRVSGFQEVFEAIIDRWVDHNRRKFDEARGAQVSGVIFDAEVEPVFWKGTTDDYAAQKLRDGFDDWLMVRTGELLNSLIERDNLGWWEEVNKDFAIFGSIHMHGEYHALTRPVNFLDVEDRQMIRDMFGAWLNFDGPFQPYRGGDVERMETEFKSQFSGVTLPGLPA